MITNSCPDDVVSVLTNPSPGLYELEIDTARWQEFAIYCQYKRGDETDVLIVPNAINRRLNDLVIGEHTRYAMGAANKPNPISFQPFTWSLKDDDGTGAKLPDGEKVMWALPVCMRNSKIILAIAFNNLGAGVEGELKIGIVPNNL